MTKTQGIQGVEKKKTDWYLIYSILIMLILCALGNLSNIVVSLLVLAMAVPLILKPEYLLGLVLFTTVFDQYILFSSGQSFSRFFVFFFLIGALIRFFPKLGKMRVDFRFWYFALFFLTGIFLSFWGLEGYVSIPFPFLFNLILMVVMSYDTIRDHDALMTHLWVGAVIAAFYSLWMITRDGLDVFEMGRVALFAGDVNANEAAMGLCVITVVLFSRFFTKGTKGGAILSMIALGISLVSLFLTGSRSSLLGALVGAIVIILVWLKQNGRNMFKGVFLCLVMATVFILIFVYMQKAFPALMERFTVENVKESGGTGRVEVWRVYFTHYFSDHWAFGIGFDPRNIFYAVDRITRDGHGAHNALVDILCSSGIFGLFLYVGFFWQTLRRIVKKIGENQNLLLIIGLLSGLLMNGIGENIVRGRFFWFSIGLAFVLMNAEKEAKRNER